ncbi:MAG: response regulator transcription factor [Parashewanella sp.]
MKLLIVEDHPELSGLLVDALGERGHICEVAVTANMAQQLLSLSSYDAVLLDLGLPDFDGTKLLAQIRASDNNGLPIVVISARDGLESRINALNYGADDYLTKPFDVDELDARLRTIIRRTLGNMDNEITFGDLKYARKARLVTAPNGNQTLSKREGMLLNMLINSTPRILVKDNLEESLYTLEDAITKNAVEALVSRMRKKLDRLGSHCQIETKRGIGYRLTFNDPVS